MTWYYADWSWIHTLTTAAAVVLTCGVLVAAFVNLVRSQHQHHGGRTA